MRGVDDTAALPELMADVVMPLWLAKARGIPRHLWGVVRWTWFPPGWVGEGRCRRRVWWVGAGPVIPSPRTLRQGLVLAVVRYLLGVPPDRWDPIAVREGPGLGRRTVYGRVWAAENWSSLQGISRPDAEAWEVAPRTVIPGVQVVDTRVDAVELDMGTRPMRSYAARDGRVVRGYLDRVDAWLRTYRHVIIVVPTISRAAVWARALPALIHTPWTAERIRLYVLSHWWTDSAHWTEVYRWNAI